MDPRVSWIQPEQLGPATELWMTFWKTLQTYKRVSDSVNYKPTPYSHSMPAHQLDFIPLSGDTDRTSGPPCLKESSPPRGGKKRRENPASTYDINYSREIINRGGMPWKNNIYPNGVVGLHMEICEFYEYMKPTDAEQWMRENVIKQVEQLIRDEWSHARVDVFGSFKTGLYLPTSDIDLVVFGEWPDLPLWRLRRLLIEKGIAEESSVKVLDRAAVPIVKLRHAETDVKVDISFNMEAGVRSVVLIKSYISEYPALPKLVFVLKQFLLQRDLNEVWTGGISSYSLILLCVSFLQLHPRNEGRKVNPNLGVLLIEFFELYGRQFNFMNIGIRVKNGGSYIKKEEVRKQMENGSTPSILCIEDPLTPGNDLGKGSYGALQVKQAFEYAYRVLNNAVLSSNYPKDCLHSTLSRILKVTDQVIEYRQEIRKSWTRPPKRNTAGSPSSLSSGPISGSDGAEASMESSSIDSEEANVRSKEVSTTSDKREHHGLKRNNEKSKTVKKCSEASSSSDPEKRDVRKPRKPAKRDAKRNKEVFVTRNVS